MLAEAALRGAERTRVRALLEAAAIRRLDSAPLWPGHTKFLILRDGWTGHHEPWVDHDDVAQQLYRLAVLDPRAGLGWLSSLVRDTGAAVGSAAPREADFFWRGTLTPGQVRSALSILAEYRPGSVIVDRGRRDDGVYTLPNARALLRSVVGW